jgi:hypothetical protein
MKTATIVEAQSGGAEALAFVLRAVSKDSGRPVLNGVSVDRVDGVARIVATDGQRLHVADWTEEERGALPPDGLYRIRMLRRRKCDEPKKGRREEWLFEARTDCGAYPNWRQAIECYGRELKGWFNRSDFSTDMDRYSALSHRIRDVCEARISVRLLKDADMGADGCEIQGTGKLSPVALVGTGGLATGLLAFVMPLRQ